MFLDKTPQKSHGGTCKIELYDLANGVNSFPDQIDFDFIAAISFPAPHDWQEIVFERWSTEPNEERVEINGSPAYRFTIAGLVHFDNSERTNILFEAERKDYLLKYTDQNGLVKIVGTPDEPVGLIARKRSGGKNYGDGTKFEVSIQCTNRLPFSLYRY